MEPTPTLIQMVEDIDLWLDYKDPTQWYTPRELMAISDAESGTDREDDYDPEDNHIKAHEAWVLRVAIYINTP